MRLDLRNCVQWLCSMVEGEKRKRWCWSDIPQELLEEILRKLTVVDYLKCGLVCRSWRRTVEDALATKGTSCSPAPQFPWLMLLPPSLHTFKRSPNLHDLLNLVYIKKPATLSDITQKRTASCTIPFQVWKGYFDFSRVYSVQGWLVFQNIYYDKNKNQNYDSILFSNPFSGEEFELPHLPLFPGQDFSDFKKGGAMSVKLVFSSAAPNSSDFLVVACATLLQIRYRRMQRLAFCKATDKEWTLIPTDQSQEQKLTFDEFIILDWKLYATSKPIRQIGSAVTLFNLRDSNIISSEKLELEPIPKGGPFSERIDGVVYIYDEECILAKDGDEILLVVQRFQISKSTETKGFRVFKLDIFGSKWIEVDDLGNRVLLMDSAGIQVISAKEIKLPRNLSGGNYVFFLKDDLSLKKRYLQVFSLKDKRITTLPLSYSLQDYFRTLLWFMPTW